MQSDLSLVRPPQTSRGGKKQPQVGWIIAPMTRADPVLAGIIKNTNLSFELRASLWWPSRKILYVSQVLHLQSWLGWELLCEGPLRGAVEVQK